MAVSFAMRKLLRTKDILLLGLSGTLDLFEEIKDPFQLVGKSYENMYGWIPRKYKRHNFMHLVWRSIKTGYIEKIEKKGEVYIRLTSQGSKKITRDFPLLSLQKIKWDKRWRVAIFDIQEINKSARDGLRKKLKELGFGMIQKSVFISPHDIIKDLSEFIKNSGLDEVVYTFEASNLATGDVKGLANKIWNLNALNEKYREITEIIDNKHLMSKRDRVKLLNDKNQESMVNLARELREKYLALILKDPFLPKELLPSDWMGYEAKKFIKNLSQIYL